MLPYLHLFGRDIPLYGLSAMLGLVLALCYLKATQPKHTPLSADTELTLIWGCIGALVGAKLLYLATVLPDFFCTICRCSGRPLATFWPAICWAALCSTAACLARCWRRFLLSHQPHILFRCPDSTAPRHPADSRLWPHRLLFAAVAAMDVRHSASGLLFPTLSLHQMASNCCQCSSTRQPQR